MPWLDVNLPPWDGRLVIDMWYPLTWRLDTVEEHPTPPEANKDGSSSRVNCHV